MKEYYVSCYVTISRTCLVISGCGYGIGVGSSIPSREDGCNQGGSGGGKPHLGLFTHVYVNACVSLADHKNRTPSQRDEEKDPEQQSSQESQGSAPEMEGHGLQARGEWDRRNWSGTRAYRYKFPL